MKYKQNSHIELAPAKLNLWLDVLRKRHDGYHDMRMINISVGLYDKLVFFLSPKPGIELSIYPPDTGLSISKDNLVIKAVDCFLNYAKFSDDIGLCINLFKNIPIGAGLAGGSSDAAAVLRGLNSLFALDLNDRDLLQMGAEIGSDVPFCFQGQLALVEGRGDHVFGFKTSLNIWAVLVKPSCSVSTSDVFERFRKSNIDEDPTLFFCLANALINNDYPNLCRSLNNTFEEIVQVDIPEIVVIKNCLKSYGSDVALMSGSGPTVYGLVRTEALARKISQHISTHGWDVWVAPVITDAR